MSAASAACAVATFAASVAFLRGGQVRVGGDPGGELVEALLAVREGRRVDAVGLR